MTSLAIDTLLGETARRLAHLASEYAHLDSEAPMLAELAIFLVRREQRTIETLERFRVDGDPNALGTFVRLADGFPFNGADVVVPATPTLDELVAVAERTDDLLALLAERVRLYASPNSVLEVLDSFDELVGARRRELTAVLRELEEFTPRQRRVE